MDPKLCFLALMFVTIFQFCEAEIIYFSSGSTFVNNFSSGSSYSHILPVPLKTVL